MTDIKQGNGDASGLGSRAPHEASIGSSPKASIPIAGAIFVQSGIPFRVETDYSPTGEPLREIWAIGADIDTHAGSGRFEIHVREIVETAHNGTIAIYERRWIDPEGNPLSRPRRVCGSYASLRALIRRRKMIAHGIVTEGGDSSEAPGAKRVEPSPEGMRPGDLP